MSDTVSEVDRDDDFYEGMIRSKVINESDYESEIVSFDVDVSWDYSWKASWGNLNRSGKEENVPFSKICEVVKMDEEELANKEIRVGARGHTWVAKENVMPELTAVIKVRLPDSDTVTMSTSRYVNGVNCDLGRLYCAYQNGDSVDVAKVTEGFEISYDGVTITFSDGEPSVLFSSSERAENIVRYLSYGERWVTVEVGDLKKSGGNAVLPVSLGESDVRFEFEKPEAKDSPLWEIVRKVECGEPIALSNEKLELGFYPVCEYSGTKIDNMWIIRVPSENVGILERIKRKVLSFV